jgi:hypothetical protein
MHGVLRAVRFPRLDAHVTQDSESETQSMDNGRLLVLVLD